MHRAAWLLILLTGCGDAPPARIETARDVADDHKMADEARAAAERALAHEAQAAAPATPSPAPPPKPRPSESAAAPPAAPTQGSDKVVDASQEAARRVRSALLSGDAKAASRALDQAVQLGISKAEACRNRELIKKLEGGMPAEDVVYQPHDDIRRKCGA